MEDKISSELKLADSSLQSFRRSLNQLNDFGSSMALLNTQWNHLEDHLFSTRNSIQQHLTELHSIRDSAQEKLDDLEKREAELNVLRESAEERIREVEAREEEFELLQEKEIQELKSQFELIEAERDSIEKKSILLREKEERLEEFNDSKARQVSQIEKEVSEARADIENKEKLCAQFSSELKLKEEQIEELSKTVALKDDKCSRLLSELEAKGKELEEKRKELELKAEKFEDLELKEKLIGERCETLELEKNKFMERCKEVELKKNLIQERYEGLELEKKKLMKRCEEVKLKENLIEGRCEGLELEEKKFIKRFESVELKEKLIAERCEKLELEKKKFMRRCQEVESKEKLTGERCEKFELEEMKFMKRCGEVELKEKLIGERCEKLELEEKKFMKRCEEVELKEKLIGERCEKLELEEKKFMKRCEEVESKEKLIGERCEKLELDEKNFMRRCEEVELKESLVDGWCEELEVEKRKLMERCEEVELDEKLIEGRCEELELEKNKITVRSVEIDLKEKLIEERCEELEVEKRKLVEQCRDVELKEKLIEERCVQLELEKNKCTEQFEGVDPKQKRIQRWREFESKEKKLFDDHRKPFLVNYAKDYPGDANLHFTVTMDGKALQIFLNEHCEEYDSVRNDVLTALSFSSDPAKLVLDAMEGFYPPHLKKGDTEFEKDVIRKSCILLLEQLLKISTDISPTVKKEAMKLAFDWITKIKADAEHSLEVLGFLQLLASYGLASAFDADELLTYLEIVAQYSQALQLFHVLGLVDKVPGFVHSLTKKKQLILAIRYIHAFELGNELPPAPLLIAFLKDSKNGAKKMRKRNATPQGQVEAANKRIADLRRAIRCIEECNIDYNAVILKNLVVQFEKENSKRDANLRRKAKASGHKIIRPFLKRKRLASNVLAPVTASATGQSSTDFLKTTSTTFVSDTYNQVQQLTANKRPRIGESVERSLDSRCGDAEQGNLPLKSKDASAASLDLQPEGNCLSVNTNKEALRHALNASENYQFAIEECLPSRCDLPVKSKDASAATDLQPEQNCLSFNTNKEALRRTLNTSEKYPSSLEECLQSTCDPGKFCFLMEQLSSDSFQITPELKEHAKDVALHWQKLLEEKRDDPVEVICFLRFVAAYKLASIFSADKLLGLLDTDYWCKHAPDLCQVLGLTDKIPIFIENLIRRQHNIEAVKYAYALNVADVFHPAFILKNHLINSSTMQDGGDIEKEIKALKDIIKCVSDFKISGLSPEFLKRRIAVLEKQKQEKLEEEKEEKPLVVQTNIVSSGYKLEQQVSTASAPITSESALNSQQQQSENNCARVDFSSPKVSIGAISTEHSPNMIMNKDVPRMIAQPICSSSRQPLSQNLPGRQDNVPSMNLPSRHTSSSSVQLSQQQHLPGLHKSQCDPGMNAPPRYAVTPMQPHRPPSYPCMNMNARPPNSLRSQHNPPGLLRSQGGDPGMNPRPPPPSLYNNNNNNSSMQPPLHHPPSLFPSQGGPSTSHPPTYASEARPYMNAPPNPYSSGLKYQQGSYTSQANNTPWNYNLPENPPKMQLQWNGFVYVPVPK